MPRTDASPPRPAVDRASREAGRGGDCGNRRHAGRRCRRRPNCRRGRARPRPGRAPQRRITSCPRRTTMRFGRFDDGNVGVAWSVEMDDPRLTVAEHPMASQADRSCRPLNHDLVERDPVRLAVARIELVDALFQVHGVQRAPTPAGPRSRPCRRDRPSRTCQRSSDLLEREIHLLDANHPYDSTFVVFRSGSYERFARRCNRNPSGLAIDLRSVTRRRFLARSASLRS